MIYYKVVYVTSVIMIGMLLSAYITSYLVQKLVMIWQLMKLKIENSATFVSFTLHKQMKNI